LEVVQALLFVAAVVFVGALAQDSVHL
jgi:hypothetical protein